MNKIFFLIKNISKKIVYIKIKKKVTIIHDLIKYVKKKL